MKPCIICGKYKRSHHFPAVMVLEKSRKHGFALEHMDRKRKDERVPVCMNCRHKYGFVKPSTIAWWKCAMKRRRKS